MNVSRSFLSVALVAASVQLAGCSAAENAVSEGGGSSTFDKVYTDVFAKSCSGCHAPSAPGYSAGETESSLDFSSADRAFATLSGQARGLSGNFAACNGVAFVVAGDASKSLLYASVDSTTRKAFVSGSCNKDVVGAMESMTIVSSAQVALVRDWINAGAKR